MAIPEKGVSFTRKLDDPDLFFYQDQCEVQIADAVEQAVRGGLVGDGTGEERLAISEGGGCHPCQPLGPGRVEMTFEANFIEGGHGNVALATWARILEPGYNFAMQEPISFYKQETIVEKQGGQGRLW